MEDKPAQRRKIIHRYLYRLSGFLLALGLTAGVDAYLTYRSLKKISMNLEESEIPLPIQHPVHKKIDYRVILHRNLFSSEPLWDVNPPPSKTSPKRSPSRPARANRPSFSRPLLPVRLVGTTVGPEGVRYAILEKYQAKGNVTFRMGQQIYRLGESIQGAQIQHIARNEVRLLYHGREITIHAFEWYVEFNQASTLTQKNSLSDPSNIF